MLGMQARQEVSPSAPGSIVTPWAASFCVQVGLWRNTMGIRASRYAVPGRGGVG